MTDSVYGNDVINGALSNLVEDQLDSKSLATQLQKYSGGDWIAQGSQDVPFGGTYGNFLYNSTNSPKATYNFYNDTGTKLSVNYFNKINNSNNGTNYYYNNNLGGNITLISPSLNRANASDQFNLSFTRSGSYSNDSMTGGSSNSSQENINLTTKIIAIYELITKMVVIDY